MKNRISSMIRSRRSRWRQERLQRHPRLGTVEGGVVTAQPVADAALGVGRCGVQRGRREAAVGRQRLDHEVEVESEPLRDLAGSRRTTQLLAQLGLDGGDPRLGLLHAARRPHGPAVVAEVAADLAADGRARRSSGSQWRARRRNHGPPSPGRGRPPARGPRSRCPATGSGARHPRAICRLTSTTWSSKPLTFLVVGSPLPQAPAADRWPHVATAARDRVRQADRVDIRAGTRRRRLPTVSTFRGRGRVRVDGVAWRSTTVEMVYHSGCGSCTPPAA